MSNRHMINEIETAKQKRVNEVIEQLSRFENLRPRTPADIKVIEEMVEKEFASAERK